MKTPHKIITSACTIWLLTAVVTAVPTTAQQSESPSTEAIEKVRALPTSEQRHEKTAFYTIPVEELGNVAPEFIQQRTELMPSPHARMPHMTIRKTINSVDYTTMVPLLVKAIQEQQTEIERLRNELHLLKAQARK